MVQISPASMQRSLTPDTWLLHLASKSGVVFFHFLFIEAYCSRLQPVWFIEQLLHSKW